MLKQSKSLVVLEFILYKLISLSTLAVKTFTNRTSVRNKDKCGVFNSSSIVIIFVQAKNSRIPIIFSKPLGEMKIG